MKKEEDFTLEDKMDAMEVLKDLNYDYPKAARIVGVATPTLRAWAGMLVTSVNKEDASVLQIKEETDVELDKRFERSAKEAKTLVLERIRNLIKEEKDMAKLTQTLKVLNEIKTEDFGGGALAGEWHEKLEAAITSVKVSVKKIKSK